MNKTEKKEYKVVMDLLAEKIKIRPDLSNVNGLFRKLFSVEYSNVCSNDEENTSTKEKKVFIKLKKGNIVYHLPIENFEMDIHDGEICMSLGCDYSKKMNVKEDQKELEELTYQVEKELSEGLGDPNLQ